jgi:hypothetical protein
VSRAGSSSTTRGGQVGLRLEHDEAVARRAAQADEGRAGGHGQHDAPAAAAAAHRERAPGGRPAAAAAAVAP